MVVASPMSTGLDSILYHLHRAQTLLRDLELEQQGTEKHILENLSILDVDTSLSITRLTDLIKEIRGEEKAALTTFTGRSRR